MRVGALAVVVWCVAVSAFANVIPVDFCDCTTFPREVLGKYEPLVAALSSPYADVNGDSSMEDTETFECEVGRNAIPDCSCELGLVSAILADPDFTATGGVSHQMVYDVYIHNWAVLRTYLGTDYDILLELLEPLLALIYGHLTIGNGSFGQVESGQYNFSGSGGYAISLIYALPTTSQISPETLDLANYLKLPQYLAFDGDADGDGFSNIDEYMASSSPAEYIAGALDPTLCGSQPIGEGEGEEGEAEGEEGEAEGEEGEAEGEEGEAEGEGEEDPIEDPPMPATTGFTTAFLLSIFLGGGILLLQAGRGRKTWRRAK